MKQLLATLFLIAGLAATLSAQPAYLNYQGRLSDAAGAPLDNGTYTLEFNIYDTANGANKVWGPFRFDGNGGNGHAPRVVVVQGRFNVILGPVDTTARALQDAFAGTNRFVEIKVDDGAAITPRQQFLSSPYAFRAFRAYDADRAAVATTVSDVNVAYRNTPNTFTGNQTVTGNVTATGNVGIGTTSPAQRLDVNGNVSFGGAANASHFFVSGNQIQQYNNAAVAAMHLNLTGGDVTLVATGPGNVGIGTTTPTRGKLHVTGAHPSVGYNIGGFLNRNGASSINNTDVNRPVSIWADNFIVALEVNAVSDARIKNIKGRSDGAADLATLSRIEITDYTLKDVIANGSTPHKKVIGQQVENIFPQAVNQHTNVVPDIYQKAEIKSGWVKLATNLKKGERVRLIGNQKEGLHEVLEVAEDKFRTDFAADGETVFVYGREVKDFRTVDYEAIAMLNVSATQELARRLEKLEKRETHLAELEQKAARVATLEQELADLKRIVAKLAETRKAAEQTVQVTPPNQPLGGVESVQLRFTPTQP